MKLESEAFGKVLVGAVIILGAAVIGCVILIGAAYMMAGGA